MTSPQAESRASGSTISNAKAKKTDMLATLRGKMEKSHKKKEAQHALDSEEGVNADLWSQKKAKRKIKLDFDKVPTSLLLFFFFHCLLNVF